MKLIALFLFLLVCCSSCDFLGIRKREFDGVIVKKYLEGPDSGFGHILVVNFGTHDTVDVETTNSFSPLYDTVEIGDTLTKRRYSYDVYLKGKRATGAFDYPFVAM